MSLDEFDQALFGRFSSGEIKLAKGFLDPDIYREGVLESVGEKENAVGNFFPDAWEFAEGGAGFGSFQGPQIFQIEFSGGDGLSGFEEVWRAKTHFAGSEALFGDGGEILGGWERVQAGMLNLFSITFAHGADDLLDLYDLFR